MSRSRWTFATIDAAPMVMLFASPLTIGCCGMSKSLSLRASTRRCCGRGASATTARRSVDSFPDAPRHFARARPRIGVEQLQPAAGKLLVAVAESAAQLLDLHLPQVVEAGHGRSERYADLPDPCNASMRFLKFCRSP